MNARRSGIVWAGLVAIVGGCLIRNPAFMAEDGTTAGSDVDPSAGTTGPNTTVTPTSSSTTSGCASAECTSTSGTSTGGTTESVDLTTSSGGTTLATGETSGTGSTTDPGTSDGSSSSGGVSMFDKVLDADIATCVISPLDMPKYAGPADCKEFVKQELMEVGMGGEDGMMIDQAFTNAGGRPAWGYMRFDLSELQGAQLISAQLRLEVKITYNIQNSGGVRRTLAFDMDSLATSAPAPQGPEGADIGATGSNGEVKMIDVKELVADPVPQWLYLLIEPQDQNGVVYKSANSSPKPTLTVQYMK